MPFFDLPQDWSAEQAIAVSDFLEQLRDTILAQYHEPIREYFQTQCLDESGQGCGPQPRPAIHQPPCRSTTRSYSKPLLQTPTRPAGGHRPPFCYPLPW